MLQFGCFTDGRSCAMGLDGIKLKG